MFNVETGHSEYIYSLTAFVKGPFLYLLSQLQTRIVIERISLLLVSRLTEIVTTYEVNSIKQRKALKMFTTTNEIYLKKKAIMVCSSLSKIIISETSIRKVILDSDNWIFFLLEGNSFYSSGFANKQIFH